ncbi:MAG: hypothetical protein ACRC9Y_07355 [Aeromonas veronii]
MIVQVNVWSGRRVDHKEGDDVMVFSSWEVKGKRTTVEMVAPGGDVESIATEIGQYTRTLVESVCGRNVEIEVVNGPHQNVWAMSAPSV